MTQGGLAVNGKLIIIGASNEPLEVYPNFFLSGRRSIVGWPSGTSIDSEDTLSFSVLSGVRPMNEIFPLEQATKAYEQMMSVERKRRSWRFCDKRVKEEDRVRQFENNNEEYVKIRKSVEEKVHAALSDRKRILKLALLSLAESLKTPRNTYFSL